MLFRTQASLSLAQSRALVQVIAHFLENVKPYQRVERVSHCFCCNMRRAAHAMQRAAYATEAAARRSVGGLGRSLRLCVQVIRDVPASRDANATCSPTLDDRQKHNYVVAGIHVTNAQEIATKMLTR